MVVVHLVVLLVVEMVLQIVMVFAGLGKVVVQLLVLQKMV